MNRTTPQRVVVIGGGISGLATAFYLRRKGFQVQVLERNARPGGLIRSERHHGFLLEHAATCVFNFLPEVDYFCQALGLAEEQVFRQPEAKKRYLVKDGNTTPVPSKATGFLTTDLISLRGKIRLLMEPFIPAAGEEAANQETVAQFITRRMGREVYENTIEPYVSGTLAGDGERACLRSTFAQFAALEDEHGSIFKGAFFRKLKGIRTSEACQARVFSFKDGMAMLPGAIAKRLGEAFIPQCTVSHLERKGPQWQITASHKGQKQLFSADAVLVATPAREAGRLLAPLSQDLGALLEGLPYSPMAVTYLGYPRSSVPHPLDGIGCLVPKRETGFDILGSLWPSTLFPQRAPEGQALFMNYLGGARNPGMVEQSDKELLARTQEDLERVVGVRGEPAFTKVIRHPRALPQYNIGHRLFKDDLQERLKQLPGVFLAGNYLQGVSVRACISEGGNTAGRIEALLSQSRGRFQPSVVENDINRVKLG